MRRGALALAASALALAAPQVALAGPPTIEASWVEGVTATGALLKAGIDPDGAGVADPTHYRFQYLTEAAYEGNSEGDRFAGAASAPPVEGSVGGANPTVVFAALSALTPSTAYFYRALARNEEGTTYGPPRLLVTEEPTNVHPPLDRRAWEMVSPVEKGGGAIATPGGLFGGGDFQAAASSATPAITYSSASAFAAAKGAPPASQYISRRGSGGWSTENVSEPLLSEGYGPRPDGVPYRVFSTDLARALLLDPRRCEAEEPCPRGYSLRESAAGALAALPAEAAGMRVLYASPDLGRVLFEAEGGEVFEWGGGGTLVPSEAPAEPEPASGIVGVLGASASGQIVYYQDAEGLKQWRSGVITTIVAGADAAAPSDWPAATGTARVSADGLHLAFLSAADIPPFDNTDASTGGPDTELYLWGPPPGGGQPRLVCASCNPTGERPQGSASIPGAQVNGSVDLYKSRALSASGGRIFFDTSDRLVAADTDGQPDVYEWEAAGEGTCERRLGCVGLVSGGRASGGTFLDASADGADAFFLSGESLVGADPGSIDVYDFRTGDGFPESGKAFVCNGDACQALPAEPEDPRPGTLVENEGNSPLRYYGVQRRKHKHRRRRHHRKHEHHHRGKRR